VYIKEIKLVMEKNLPKEKAPDTGHLTKNQNRTRKHIVMSFSGQPLPVS
jgi:hypothetical protein